MSPLLDPLKRVRSSPKAPTSHTESVYLLFLFSLLLSRVEKTKGKWLSSLLDVSIEIAN